MPVERLTAEDLLMLWPDQIWPQEIGALAILDGRNLLDPGGRFRIEAVRDVVTARLHLVPRFGQLRPADVLHELLADAQSGRLEGARPGSIGFGHD